MIKGGRKSQISVFIIIAILIFGMIVIGFFIFTNSSGLHNFISSGSVSSEVVPIYESMKDCSFSRSLDAIRLVGLRGGYINLPKNYLSTEFSEISYGYYDGKNTLPTKEVIEKEISSYVKTSIPYCVTVSNSFGYNITNEEPVVSTRIEKESVFIDTRIPLYVTKDGKSYKIDRSYNSEIPIRLGGIIDTANGIVNREIRDPSSIDLTYLAQIDYYTAVLEIDDNSSVYIITDDKSKLDGVSYSFMFANKVGGVL